MPRKLLLFALMVCALGAQDDSLPLESVAIEGTHVYRNVVLEIAGLRIGAPVNKASIDSACEKLQKSGIFGSIDYSYAPGPKQEYALTLALADQTLLSVAAVDVPGVDEAEVWTWLVSQFPDFDHKIPEAPAAQEFLAARIESHLGPKLKGHHIVVNLETNFSGGASKILSFQPDVLPRVGAMTFTGNREFSAEELLGIMNKVAAGQEYTDRRYRTYVELNLRPAYETRGMYRVQFPAIVAQESAPLSVVVATTIVEGAKYTLGNVRILGDSLPLEGMVKAGALRSQSLANWTEIQNGIWEMEKVVRRTGYFESRIAPHRIFHDDQRVLDLDLAVSKGPLYRYGEVSMIGLPASLESKLRSMWKPRTGEPYDYGYPNEFLQSLARSAEARQIKKMDAKAQKGSGDHVMDIKLTFEPK